MPRGMDKANLDLEVFQETKVTEKIYTCASVGYHVLTSDAPIRHCRGLAIFHQDVNHFQVEAFQLKVAQDKRDELSTEFWREKMVYCRALYSLPTTPQPSTDSSQPLASAPAGILCWWPVVLTST